jgi:pyruvate formate lyase activating enzyme
VKEALREAGYPVASTTEEAGLFAPCGVGACGACVVEIDGEEKRACHTGVREGMQIRTEAHSEQVPVRMVAGFQANPEGVNVEPWCDRVREDSFPEICCFVCGCNFRCPQCQNWRISYKGTGTPLAPGETARDFTHEKEARGFKKVTMSISGGECTLNRPWLVQFVRELRRLNSGPSVRIQVNTNGSLLTHGYIDELVEAGMSDIVIDLKALHINNFMLITGLKEEELAERYKETAWEAVRYISREYKAEVFLGVGFPYNRELNPLAEIKGMGERLYGIGPSIPVNIQNYRGEFRSRIVPAVEGEMKWVHQALKKIGLEVVIYQTAGSFVGP